LETVLEQFHTELMRKKKKKKWWRAFQIITNLDNKITEWIKDLVENTVYSYRLSILGIK
jgi:hypothetical protein